MPKTGAALSKRACDSCKQRKVKCDSTQPCANCRISRLDCTFNVAPRKRGPKTPLTRTEGQTAVAYFASRSTRRRNSNHEQEAEPRDCIPEGSVTPAVFSLIEPTSSASKIRKNLNEAIAQVLPSHTIRQVVDECISLFVLHMFPVAPVCHVPMLRTMAASYFPLDVSQGVADHLFDHGTDQDRVANLRPFTLVTSMCAAISSIYPDSILAYRGVVATPFLRASRSMLKVYEDYDTQHPNSTSLAIRLFQSAALQHSAGKTPLAWHVLSQAGLLAQNLRLHSEHALEKYDPLEATLLRNNFWMLYVCDKAAIALANRPVTLHEPLFDSVMDIREIGQYRVSLLDSGMRNVPESFEETLMEGFHLIKRCWTSAGRLLLAIRNKRPDGHLANTALSDKATDKEAMAGMYVEFMRLLDELPPWLESPDTAELDSEYDVAFQRSCFWTQKSRLVAMFHSVRIMVLRQCIENGLTTFIGLNNDPLILAMEQTSIARDVVQSLKSIPFRYIQTNGEPGIELMRVVGSILLEVSQNVENTGIQTRATSLLSSLLDILARLDSKASEDLVNQQV